MPPLRLCPNGLGIQYTLIIRHSESTSSVDIFSGYPATHTTLQWRVSVIEYVVDSLCSVCGLDIGVGLVSGLDTRVAER